MTNSNDEGRRALAEWLDAARSGAKVKAQHPADELVAEHRLLAPVLDAMELEANQVRFGKLIRIEFWEGVVDFTGNFIHLCHRRKEEEALFDVAESLGWVERPDLAEEHRRAVRATLAIIESVSDGDWEMTVRLAAAYATGMRKHMAREEQGVFALIKEKLPDDRVRALGASFDAIDTAALAKGRKPFVDVVVSLCKATKLDPKTYGL
ncbi:hemerythrin domain-containing protein [Myxococcota bacterium]|nr:hemerythrin domain-containing protein [Myxococcota bacterium]